ncbi:MAG: tetratricopeptide (TPR) repeat protein [Planctomycetota bacterium]|jgi:tetratricopeptide (TPR) repeat protein
MGLAGNAEGVRFVQGLKESSDKGVRPPQRDVQRLKKLALQYPGESSIEAILTSLLIELEDWEGLSTYFEAKEDLNQQDRFTQTWAYLNQMDYPSARATIEAFAKANGESMEAQRLLARACYLSGDYDLAAASYDSVWDKMLSQGHTADIAFRAMIDFDRGEIQRALSLLNGALLATPDSIPVLNSLSRILASQGKLKEAEIHSNHVARLQEAQYRKVTDQRRRSSRVSTLNAALEDGDFAGCERMIFQWLPDESGSFAEELVLFLERMYRMTGRESELENVINRARAAGRKQ